MDTVGLLEATEVTPLTPHMLRVTFTAPEDFTTWPDQQIKLFFPRPGQSVPHLPTPDADEMRWYQAYLSIPEPERPWMRSFTVRAHRPAHNELDIDFVLHGNKGPATRWAATAAPGQILGRYGPAEIYRRDLPTSAHYVLAGDETALPAIGSLLESLPATAEATVLIEVASPEEEQRLTSPATTTLTWLHRNAGASLEAAFPTHRLPPDPTCWLAGESGMVRTLRRHLISQGIPKTDIEFTGYWRRSLTQDDAPTPDDLADARERLDQATSY